MFNPLFKTTSKPETRIFKAKFIDHYTFFPKRLGTFLYNAKVLIEDQIQRFSVSQHSQRHKKLIKYSHHTHQKPTDLMTMHPISGWNKLATRKSTWWQKRPDLLQHFLQTNYSNLINVRSFAKSPSVLPFLKSHYELVMGRVLPGIRVFVLSSNELNVIWKRFFKFILPNIVSILNLTIFQTGARQRCFKT